MILLKFNMLEIKKDRLKEVESQIRKAYKTKYAINIKPLLDEKTQLKSEIKHMEGDMLGR